MKALNSQFVLPLRSCGYMCLTEAILIGLRRIDLRPIAPDKLWQHCTDKGSRVDWRPPPDTSDEPANAP